MKILRWTLLLGLVACSSPPPAPDWLLSAESALAGHDRLWLTGLDQGAASQLALARAAVARTGDASQMARLELHVCALHLASLQGGDCPAFAPLAADAGRPENAYANYLAGRLDPADSEQLPPAQALAWRQPESWQQIPDPLSRLVAAAALLAAGRLPPTAIADVIETAAGQGWQRPLLAWLNLERERLQRAGETSAAAAIERRIGRILGDGR